MVRMNTHSANAGSAIPVCSADTIPLMRSANAEAAYMKNDKKERGSRITGEWPLFRMNILIS